MSYDVKLFILTDMTILSSKIFRQRIVISFLFFFFQFDLKNHRIFLHRVHAETVRISDLYVGSTINVLSRQLTFVDFGDEFTRNRVSSRTERQFETLNYLATMHCKMATVYPKYIGHIGHFPYKMSMSGVSLLYIRHIVHRHSRQLPGEIIGSI